MKIPKEKKLEFFSELKTKAVAEESVLREKLIEYERQYKGTKYFGGKGQQEPAKVVRNITYELIESQVDTSIPVCRVDPERWSESNGRNAKSIERLCNGLRNKKSTEKMNDMDERYTYVFGGSVFLIEWDDSKIFHGEVGDVDIRLYNPRRFIGQPGIRNVEDMDYAFIELTATAGEVEQKYGKILNERTHEEFDENDNIIVTVCYYYDENHAVSRYIFTGDTELEDIDDYYSRKRLVCDKCGRIKEPFSDEDTCACGGHFEAQNDEYEELTRDIVLSDGRVIPAMSPIMEDGKPVLETIMVNKTGDDGQGGFSAVKEPIQRVKMEPTRIKWYKPKTLPFVIRKNTAQIDGDDLYLTEGEKKFDDVAPDMIFLGQSDCEYIKYQQWEANKYESRIHEKLLKASVSGVVPEDAEIQKDNSVFENVIRLKHGEHPNLYGTLDNTPNISYDVLQSDRMYDQAKKTLGISASFQGQDDSTALSGKAKQVQAKQSAGRLTSKRVNKGAAYAEIDRIVFELMLAYASEPRPTPYKDEWGRMANASFNRYDFLAYDEITGEWYWDDRYLFSVDASASTEEIREEVWKINAENFAAGMFGNPQEITTLIRYWQAQEKAHFPNAQDQVNHFVDIMRAQQAAQAQQAAKAPAGLPSTQNAEGEIL